jgi:hypothetical protein
MFIQKLRRWALIECACEFVVKAKEIVREFEVKSACAELAREVAELLNIYNGRPFEYRVEHIHGQVNDLGRDYHLLAEHDPA